MAKTQKATYRCLIGIALALILGVTLCFVLSGTTSVAYAAENTAPIVVGDTYTFSDSGGEYSVTIISETEYELHAVKGDESFDYKGAYTYIDGKLTLTAFEETLGVFYIQGSNLVKIVESDITETEPPTFFGRIWEWVTTNKAEIITVIGNLLLLCIMIAREMKSKKKLASLGTDLLTIGKSVSTTEISQGDVVSVTNELIKGYNKFEKALSSFEETEGERYKTILAAFAQTKAILEILTTVYANSKNIPQGVKDLVNLKYADVLKIVGDEDKLREIAEPTETSEETAEGRDETEG